MTYEQIQQANATIKTTDIKGKEYADVSQRVKAFRMCYPTGWIRTEMLSNIGEVGKHVCVFRAEVGVGDQPLGTGTAYEREDATYINKTSYIENCETSAVGRALGFAGFGIDTSIASADEVQNAMANQTPNQTPKRQQAAPKPQLDRVQIDSIRVVMEQVGQPEAPLLNAYGVARLDDLTQEQYQDAMERLTRCKSKKRRS